MNYIKDYDGNQYVVRCFAMKRSFEQGACGFGVHLMNASQCPPQG